MQLLCATCGQHNPSDRQFCLACNSYLGPDSKLVAGPGDDEGARPEQQTATVAFHPDESLASQDDAAPTLADTTIQPVVPRQSVPTAPRRPAASVETAPCPQCSTPNRPELRFCRKCGYALPRAAAATTQQVAAPAKEGWWARVTSRLSFEGSSAARTAYRRSLPLRYRLFRIAGTLLGAAVFGGGLAALHWWGTDVTSWPQHLF